MQNTQIISKLQKERNELTRIIEEARAFLKHAPEGSVRITKHKKGAQFYHRKKRSDRNGSYIPASEQGLAETLIRKQYLSELLKAAEKQRAIIESFLRRYEPAATHNVFEREGEIRRAYLMRTFCNETDKANQAGPIPIVLPDEEYEGQWMANGYQMKPFRDDAPEHYTQRNLRVRSKSEVIIANTLDKMEIPYRYEYPVKICGTVIHPDFTILRIDDRKEIYWEHLGMMDDAEYRNNAFQRIRMYEKTGIFPGDGLIVTVETGRLPMNARVAEQMIRRYILESL